MKILPDFKIISKKLSVATALIIRKQKGEFSYILEIYNYMILCFKLTLNNIHFIFSVSDGTPFYNLSAGKLRYRNSQKTTALATRVLSLRVIEVLEHLGQCFIHLRIKGFGQRLKIFLQELNILSKGDPLINPIHIAWVEKSTIIPLNGCKNARRVF